MGTSSPVNMSNTKPQKPAPNLLLKATGLDAAADQAIEACGGEAREAVKALRIANEFLERKIEARVLRGYVRGVKHVYAIATRAERFGARFSLEEFGRERALAGRAERIEG